MRGGSAVLTQCVEGYAPLDSGRLLGACEPRVREPDEVVRHRAVTRGPVRVADDVETRGAAIVVAAVLRRGELRTPFSLARSVHPF